MDNEIAAKAAYKALFAKISAACEGRGENAATGTSVVRTIVAYMAAIFSSDGKISIQEINLIEEMIEGIQVESSQFIVLWSQKWERIGSEVPYFIELMLRADKEQKTWKSLGIVEDISSFGKQVASIDGSPNESELKIIADYAARLTDHLRREGIVANESVQQPTEDLLGELERLVGIKSVKGEVSSLINFAKISKLRADQGLKAPAITRHLVFVGNPGTGKTTVARILSKIYAKLKLVEKGHLVETDRSGLIAGYSGQTALKVTEVVERALGGVLFIDEAYALMPKEASDYASEAVATLLKLIEDHRTEMVVILAGYENEMERFMDANPGLRSRFAKTLRFADYTQSELGDIFVSLCSANHYTYDEQVGKLIYEAVGQLPKLAKGSFSNARAVRTLFEEVVSNQANRVANMENARLDDLATILPADIPDDVMLASMRFK